MRSLLFTIVVAAGMSFFFACNPQPEASSLLEEAGHLVERHPDSAMLLIDSIFYPEKSFNHAYYMRFLVTQVQAKYKTYRPIHEDTLIFRARDFFSAHNKDPRITALAWFYSGCVYRERKEYEKAMGHYLRAGDYATEAGDNALQGLIQYNLGDLFAVQDLYPMALERYKSAARFYNAYPEEEAYSLSAVGRMFLLSGEKDSAFLYFHKGLDIAETKGDLKLQSLLSQNLGIAYRENWQYDKAETYLRQSYLLNSDSVEIPRHYLNFAKLYAGMGQPDSVAIYTGKLNHSVDSLEDNSFRASIYQFLASTESEKGNYKTAFDYHQKYTHVLIEIMNDRNRQSVYEANQKYNFELQQSLIDSQYRTMERLIVILIVVGLTGALTFTLFILRQRNKQFQAQQKIGILRNMANDLKRLHDTFELDAERKIRRLMMERFDTVKKVALLNSRVREDDPAKKVLDKFNEIVYGTNYEEEWLALFQVFNEIYPDVSDVIRQRYPQLTNTEFRVFILSYESHPKTSFF
ncbi:MAG: hypothetical protein WC126_05590 [Proteiniphilum sp.]